MLPENVNGWPSFRPINNRLAFLYSGAIVPLLATRSQHYNVCFYYTHLIMFRLRLAILRVLTIELGVVEKAIKYMKICLKSLSLCAAMALLVTSSGPKAHAGPISLSVETAGLQTSAVQGVTTETFDGFSTGQYSSLTTAVGTLSTAGSLEIVAADIFGGAGGSGDYFSLGAQSGSADPVTLTFNGPQSFFGIWWSAADVNNTLTFYSGATELATFNTSSVFAGLGNSYYGNPNNGGDTGEPFAYMNFNGVSGTTFTSVVFTNNGTTSTGFESDNWSISSVPEPSSLVLSSTAAVILGLALRRRRPRVWPVAQKPAA
jgi:hypothetical protein